MKIQAIRLGTVCKDRATDLKGTLTHWLLDMDQTITYLFQPEGINPENGQPVAKISLEQARLEVPQNSLEEIDVPFEILGSTVTDKASGFSGMAVDFVRHVNGCFHVVIQPKGVLPKTNSPIGKADFDLRQCSGDKIPEFKPAEVDKSRKDYPSPTGDTLDAFERHQPR